MSIFLEQTYSKGKRNKVQNSRVEYKYFSIQEKYYWKQVPKTFLSTAAAERKTDM